MLLEPGRELYQLPRRIYLFRIVGMALGGVAAACVLLDHDAPIPAWAFLVFCSLLWPHLAYQLAIRSRDPYQAEIRNLVVDSILAGSLVAMMHFNLLPSVLLVTLTTVDKISTGIRKLWRLAVPTMLLSTLAMATLTGFAFEPASSMRVVLACLPLIVIHTTLVSMGSYRLIRKVRRQNLELDRLRRTDALTGVSGRGHWQEQAERLIQRTVGDPTPSSVLLIDIDNFKQINDAHGHGAGDAVLKQIGDILHANIRQGDCAGRLGGDEFAVLLPGMDVPSAMPIADRMRTAVERIRIPDYPDVRPTISVGLATATAGQGSLRDWLDDADAALYRAKKLGRNQVAIST